MTRRGYLDWLRGLAVLIMIEAHTFDAWTSLAERDTLAYRWAIILGGFAAPAFLFFAGVTLALAGGARLRRGLSDREVASAAARWGWKIFGLAFLFRLQSWLISGGPFPRTLLKVDILNVMGLAMVAAAGLWALGRTRAQRVAWLGAAAVTVALVAPLRSAGWVAEVPRPFVWYLAPVTGWTTFSLVPWVGFLFAGAALGLALDAAATPEAERRLMGRFAVWGSALAGASFGASLMPSWYETSSYWTTSPSFFFLRLGLLLVSLPLAYAWAERWPGWGALRRLGAASFFVYWVHVELVYGVVTLPLHRALSFEWALAGYLAVVLLVFWLVGAWERFSWPPAFLRPEPAAASGPAGVIS